MKIIIRAVGKTKESYLTEGIKLYLNKLKHYGRFQYIEQTRKTIKSSSQQILQDDQNLLSELTPGDFLILLDESGKQYSSKQFSAQIDRWQMQGRSRLVFAIGGAYGHGSHARSRADATMSLSSFTFTHDMARLIFLEQLYRAMTILRNEPYHNP